MRMTDQLNLEKTSPSIDTYFRGSLLKRDEIRVYTSSSKLQASRLESVFHHNNRIYRHLFHLADKRDDLEAYSMNGFGYMKYISYPSPQVEG